FVTGERACGLATVAHLRVMRRNDLAPPPSPTQPRNLLHRRAGDHRAEGADAHRQANELAAAKHRDELAQFQTDLLQKNTDPIDEIHELSQKVRGLLEEVYAAMCKGASA
ncbi:MAG TPA: hypothetical protein VMU65_08875, partial [Candidatus Saccharimonadales bacterium]|nr:hypothetical protein [Candidatus Saccharimonadales bacterium]